MLSLIENMDIGEYIYLQNDDQLMKFKVEFHHMDIVNAIECYISSMDVYNFKLVNKKEAKKLKTPLKFFPYLGKFRLENGIVKTQNYLVPQHCNKELLSFLNRKYEDSKVTPKDLKSIYKIKQSCIDFGKNNEFNLINELCLNANIELVESYKFNENVGIGIIEYIKNLVGEENSNETINKLKSILLSSKENNKIVEFLGLKFIFIDVAEETRKNKVK